MKRLPFVYPSKELENKVSLLAENNVNIKRRLLEFSIIEITYAYHPLMWIKDKTGFLDLRKLVKTYLDYENKQQAIICQLKNQA